MSRKYWNRCDVCGRHISIHDFAYGLAVKRLLVTETTREEYLTLCKFHAEPEESRSFPK